MAFLVSFPVLAPQGPVIRSRPNEASRPQTEAAVNAAPGGTQSRLIARPGSAVESRRKMNQEDGFDEFYTTYSDHFEPRETGRAEDAGLMSQLDEPSDERSKPSGAI